MPRPKKLDRPVLVRAYIPQSVYDKLEMELYSDLEGKIPFGKMSELFTELASDWLRAKGIAV